MSSTLLFSFEETKFHQLCLNINKKSILDLGKKNNVYIIKNNDKNLIPLIDIKTYIDNNVRGAIFNQDRKYGNYTEIFNDLKWNELITNSSNNKIEFDKPINIFDEKCLNNIESRNITIMNAMIVTLHDSDLIPSKFIKGYTTENISTVKTESDNPKYYQYEKKIDNNLYSFTECPANLSLIEKGKQMLKATRTYYYGVAFFMTDDNLKDFVLRQRSKRNNIALNNSEFQNIVNYYIKDFDNTINVGRSDSGFFMKKFKNVGEWIKDFATKFNSDIHVYNDRHIEKMLRQLKAELNIKFNAIIIEFHQTTNNNTFIKIIKSLNDDKFQHFYNIDDRALI